MTQVWPIVVSAWSKQADLRPFVCWDWGGGVSNPPGGMDICVLWGLCVVMEWSLRWADHSSRAFLQAVVYLPVFDPENLKWGGLGPVGISIHEKDPSFGLKECDLDSNQSMSVKKIFWGEVRNNSTTLFLLSLYLGATALMGKGLLIIEDSWSHSDTPHSVRLLWTGDQPDAETSTWQHTTLTRDRHPCP